LERGHGRGLSTVFGRVSVTRLAYRAVGAGNLHPADGALNLPAGLHSHGLRRLVALEAARGSFDDAVAAVERATGVRVGKRQLVELAGTAAVDVDGFYARMKAGPTPDALLVLQFDGKGVVMRPEGLRPATAKAAAAAGRKLATRLSPGEKNGRKRMAELAAVHDAAPVVRTPRDVLPPPGQDSEDGPKAAGKWLTASVVDDIATVVAAGFDEATRRDPHHACTWVVLVDGNQAQLDAVTAEAKRRSVQIHILIDFIHVLEYLWKAGWSFFDTGDPDAEAWVTDKARKVLAGHATDVATGIRRRATYNGYDQTERKGADTAAAYLDAKAAYLDYATALAKGWPIATGVIEGACRHLVKDSMDITGARWGLDGAEAILTLRAVIANRDFDDYWTFHLDQERHRNHNSQYADNRIPP
ncbi:ISKra4 family transposase, partial [Frankia gtarii]